jgi:hypothetical protein
MRNRYTKGLVGYGGNRRIFRPQGDPLSSRVSDCLATPLALANSWKSKGAARRRIYERAEILELLRSLENFIYPPSAAAPAIRHVRYNLFYTHNPITGHSIKDLACGLYKESTKKSVGAR